MRYFYCIAECDCINKGKLQKVTQIKFENGKTIKYKYYAQLCKNTSRDCTCRYRIKDITYFNTRSKNG
jgi:hypothetical protein